MTIDIIEIIPVALNVSLTVGHLTVVVVVDGAVTQFLPTVLHGTRPLVKEVPRAVDVLFPVLHLPLVVVVNILSLASDILNPSLHCTSTFVKVVPVAVDILLAVLHLPGAVIVNDLVAVIDVLEASLLLAVFI